MRSKWQPSRLSNPEPDSSRDVYRELCPAGHRLGCQSELQTSERTSHLREWRRYQPPVQGRLWSSSDRNLAERLGSDRRLCRLTRPTTNRTAHWRSNRTAHWRSKQFNNHIEYSKNGKGRHGPPLLHVCYPSNLTCLT